MFPGTKQQNLPNQYQFSSWQPSSNGQKTTLMLFLCSCLFAFTGWGSSRPFVGWSWCLFQLNPLSWMKNLYLSYTKKNKNLQNCSYVACSHQMSLRIFEWVLITLRSWSYAVVSFAKFSKCSKNQQCWFRENAVWHLGTFSKLELACMDLVNHRFVQLAAIVTDDVDAVAVLWQHQSISVLKLYALKTKLYS